MSRTSKAGRKAATAEEDAAAAAAAGRRGRPEGHMDGVRVFGVLVFFFLFERRKDVNGVRRGIVIPVI